MTYKIRDWLVSRQRYWGAPIPIVYCDEHGAQPVPEDQLPVLLPDGRRLRADRGQPAAVARASSWRPPARSAARPARRETDTMDTFVDSAWYFLRYCSPNDDARRLGSGERCAHWMPVDLYTGGAEHAVLHLMYCRFFVKALRDMGHLSFDEPFLALRNQGQILGADHQRMSKSRGNVRATPTT